MKQLADIKAGFADGFVIHHRKIPNNHRFKYNMCWHLINVAVIDQWAQKSLIRKYNGGAIFSLYDKDYINSDDEPIYHKIRSYLNSESGYDFNGNVVLMTHPRFLGYGFNSVNFYFCYKHDQLEFIISEINNTPWGEKHLYLHDCRYSDINNQTEYLFDFKKKFHISPFVGMDVVYNWRFLFDQNKIKINMKLHQNNVKILTVVLDTDITSEVDNLKVKDKLRRLFQPWKMVLGIYWQAFRLWLKKIPFHAHPKKH